MISMTNIDSFIFIYEAQGRNFEKPNNSITNNN